MRQFNLLFLDIALLFGSLATMVGIRYDDQFAAHYALHLVPFGILFVLWLLVFYIANLYDPRTLRNTTEFYSRLIQSILTAAVISTSFFYLIPFFGITPKTNLFIFIVVFTLLEMAGRTVFNNISETQFKKTALIVGDNQQTRELRTLITANPQFGYVLHDIIDAKDTARLSTILNEAQIDTIIISPDIYHLTEITEIFYKALSKKINFCNLVTFYERLTGQVPLGAINQIWFLENLTEGAKESYEAAKRVGDIVFGCMFGALSLVLYPFIILAIRWNSPGPLFYSQKRIGQLGEPFYMLKFRTMVANAEAETGAKWAEANDSRVTAVGKFLRRMRLDELPQLWNILKGEMSLVGPRAERPEFHDVLKREVPFYEERYLIKPGLSGWAQINFHYGSSVDDAAEKLKYDLYYIKNRSIILDIGIVLKTIRIALSQAGK